MMDDLRDYRYYKEDMIHPNEQAIEYIWQHFNDSFIDEEALDFICKWQRISDALKHRPFNPSTSEHQKFLKNTLDEIVLLKEKVNIEREIALLEARII
jgi:hypothetical protein